MAFLQLLDDGLSEPGPMEQFVCLYLITNAEEKKVAEVRIVDDIQSLRYA